MALSASVIWEVEPSANDLNGATFDPSVTGFATDGAATSATGSSPVFSSASYTFVSGDIGAWVFIKSGTNWLPGWYKIASVSAGAATLSAASGAGITYSASLGRTATTVAGVASTASPTGATWGLDYSQQTSPHVTFNGSTVTAATSGTSTTITLTGYTPGVNDVGNGLQIASGTNFVAGYYTVESISGATWVLDRNCTSGVGAAMVGRAGGALTTITALFGAFASGVSNQGTQNQVAYVQGGSNYTVTSAIALSGSNVPVCIGYTTTRQDNGVVTLTTSTNSTDLFHISSAIPLIAFYNFNFTNTATTRGDGINWTGSVTVNKLLLSNCTFDGCLNGVYVNLVSVFASLFQLWAERSTFKNCTNSGIRWNNNIQGSQLYLDGCLIKSNTNNGVQLEGPTNVVCIFLNTVIRSNGSHNIAADTAQGSYEDPFIRFDYSLCRDAGGDGIRLSGGGTAYPKLISMHNSIFWNNAGWNVNLDAVNFPSGAVAIGHILLGADNAMGAGGSGNFNNVQPLADTVTLTADPNTNASGDDYTLNNTAGGGAACQGLSWPTAVPG